jgi:branched-chain amino acid transport system ATP-binding protein
MLEVRDLTAGYDNTIVLRNITFSVNHKEILTIIGPNGAGKSTLLWVLSGLLKPKSGKVLLEGKNITGWGCTNALRSGILHVLQGTPVFGELSVEDNLVLGVYGKKVNFKILKEKHFPNVYKHFPVLERKSRQLAGSLSGGEKQMLCIARALISEPKLIMLDEPSAGLAPLIVENLFEILHKLRDEISLTTLLIEQNAEAALRIADRAMVLAQGEIKFESAVNKINDYSEISRIYLGLKGED